MLKRRFDPTPEQLEQLRYCSDREMKKRHGLCAGTWGRIRKRHGIERFRNPTTIGGMPSPWKPKPEKKDPSFNLISFWRAPDPQRDHSVLGEAASYLQRQRFIVFNRKVQGDTGWQVGRSVLDDAAMLSKAQRLGFKVEGWMG